MYNILSIWEQCSQNIVLIATWHHSNDVINLIQSIFFVFHFFTYLIEIQLTLLHFNSFANRIRLLSPSPSPRCKSLQQLIRTKKSGQWMLSLTWYETHFQRTWWKLVLSSKKQLEVLKKWFYMNKIVSFFLPFPVVARSSFFILTENFVWFFHYSIWIKRERERERTKFQVLSSGWTIEHSTSSKSTRMSILYSTNSRIPSFSEFSRSIS